MSDADNNVMNTPRFALRALTMHILSCCAPRVSRGRAQSHACVRAVPSMHAHARVLTFLFLPDRSLHSHDMMAGRSGHKIGFIYRLRGVWFIGTKL
jgi:hypothetical protein